MRSLARELPLPRRNSGFDVFYAPEPSAARWLRDESVLAVIRFGARTEARDPRDISIALPPLGARRIVEVWHSPSPIGLGREGEIHYATNGEIVFGHLLLEDDAQMAATAKHAYSQVLNLIQQLEYPHLLRLWNYFPGINLEADGLERYRAFCVGRFEAFRARGSGDPDHRLSAASAIGTRGAGFLLYFVAGREPGTPVENPRQVCAYHYPNYYAPRSPLFSRATLKRWNGATHLYISGTASIVGHRTYHVGDTLEQLRETTRNLSAVVSAANELHPLACKSPAQLSHLKIYLRQAEDFAQVEAEVDRLFGEAIPKAYLAGDVCRRELLLEIDAFYSEP
ncbi:MAG TPA: hypothetical protein VLA73_08845 [Burkholderiales bacterium]|nr:hypothetical protein [Burkholderiales bacterium]